MSEPHRHTLSVEGMTCQHCVRAVTQALTERDPTCTVIVDLAAKTVTVQSGLEPSVLKDAIEAEGYRVV